MLFPVFKIFASATAGHGCVILLAKECNTPANKSLIKNDNFQEKIKITRENKLKCLTYFSGGHIFSK